MPTPIQNQVSQLNLKFSGPLVKDWQVRTKTDLLSLTNNYEYRLVWVDEVCTFFYLAPNTTGDDLSHWIEYGSSATIQEHNQNQTYNLHECVYTPNGNLYISINPVPADIDINDTIYWLQLSGSSVTMYVPFEDQSEVFINSLINNPIFQVFIDDTLCDAEIKKVNQENNLWKISFYEDEELIFKTGYIVVK